MKKSPNKADATNMRIGVFRGTFDPIHVGHIAFAKQAILAAKLDYVYFLPEKVPQHKKSVGDYKKRLTTIARAAAHHANLSLLELPNMQGYIEPMLPEIRKTLGNARLVFLMGSDVAKTIHQWPDVDSLCSGNELVVGMRSGDKASEIQQVLDGLSVKPLRAMILKAPLPDVTSSTIRQNSS
ncbi:nicotinate-nicotinamide nucleotide adenylyltransferase [Candidatus Saccharibacteria bacterium]|nr:nicotinate-nicotinamide nucleotide adenylyltransferase [Candidatus Saccharibacteria bacterium]